MITTRFDIQGIIDADAETVWALIRDFNGLPTWHPFVVRSEIVDGLTGTTIGAIRRFEQSNGAIVKEKLIGLDDFRYSMTYFLLEAPIPVQNYFGFIELVPLDPIGKTLMTWTVDYDVEPDQASELEQGLKEVLAMGFSRLNELVAA